MFYLVRFASMFMLGIVMLVCTSGANSSPKQPSESQVQSATSGLDPKETGYYEIKGTKIIGTTRHSVSNAGLRRGNEAPVRAEWPVTKEEFEKLKEGMRMEEVRKALALDALNYNPPDGKYRLQLVFERGPARVTLTFSGSPEVKLSGMSAEGLK